MRSKISKSLRILGLVVGIVIICYGAYSVSLRAQKIIRVNTLKDINDFCNSSLSNVDENEKKIKELLKSEDDPLTLGKYNSALVQINIIRGDYDSFINYSKEAINNYKKVKFGEYYAISESKNVLWALTKMDKFSEVYILANEIVNMINEGGDKYLSFEELVETETIINSSLLTIYSTLGLEENSKIYYEKLCSYSFTEEQWLKLGEIVLHGKYKYAKLVNDPELQLKLATENYRVVSLNDEKYNTNMVLSAHLPIAYANIRLGNYDNVLNDLEYVREYCNKYNDSKTLSLVQFAYAEYLMATNEIDEAAKVINDTIPIMKDNKDYINAITLIDKFIMKVKESNNKIDLVSFYEDSYNFKSLLLNDYDIINILEESIILNDSVNGNKIAYLHNKSVRSRNVIVVFALIIIMVLIALIKTIKLYKVKDINAQNLTKIANTDYLTGVYSRGYGYSKLNKLIDSRTTFSLGILDIDNFKKINDEYGHVIGDMVLSKLAEDIKASIRKDDIILRFGGEEFIVVFPHTKKADAKKVLDRIRINTSKVIVDNKVNFTFSAGVTSYNGVDNIEIDDLISKADKLLYKAKNSGKNKIIEN